MSWLDRILGDSGEGPAAPAGDPDRVAEVESVLAEMRPYFEADGGDVRLVAVEGSQVVVTLRGACGHCAMSSATLYGALEPELKRRFPWVEGLRSQ